MRRSMQIVGRSVARVWLPLLLLAAMLKPAQADSARDMLSTGRADEAVQTLERQIDRDPNDAESYNLLCRAYFMMEEWDRGIPACERATKLDPQNSLYHLWLGRIYGEKASRVGFLSAAGLAKKVRASFERAVQLDPKNWEARVDLAEFYLQAPSIVGGGQDKARAQAEALFSLNPAMAHWILARVAGRNKDAAGAELEYKAAIAASHGAAQHWLHLAQFFAHADRLIRNGPSSSHYGIEPARSPRRSDGRWKPAAASGPRLSRGNPVASPLSRVPRRGRAGLQSARFSRPGIGEARGPARRRRTISGGARAVPRLPARPRRLEARGKLKPVRMVNASSSRV